jgi:hypothetical protein
MAKGLGKAIKVVVTSNKLRGLHLHNDDQSFSHQQFVDDTLLMAQPTIQEAKAIQQILKDFGQASGMDLNTTKSQIFFFHMPLADSVAYHSNPRLSKK